MRSSRPFFIVLFVAVLAARLCHTGILWAEETLPMAAAAQMLEGKALYRQIWFDKPPLLPAAYLLWGAAPGWPLRLAGALYVLLACWIASRFARELWGKSEGFWAAGLLAFYLTFDIPSAVLPLAADLLMLAPHLAAVYLAWKGRAFWSGCLAGIAFLVNPKGLFVLAACALWQYRSPLLLGLGFLLPNAAAGACLWVQGSLAPYWFEVWRWGSIYAGRTFVDDPLGNGLVRSLNWAGFHALAVFGAVWFWFRERKRDRWRWLAWAALSFAAVAAGWRFFPRYFFQILPVLVLAGSRGWTLLLAGMSRKRLVYTAAAALLLVPFIRFGPRYALLAADLAKGRRHDWVDVAMDRDSRAAAKLARSWSRPGDTLFVWGYRPELYIYTGLPAASRFLDSQPLTGVPADRHLTQSQPVATESTAAHRRELMRSHPDLILDGLGPYNPRLAIEAYADLHPWLAEYRPVARSNGTVIYRLSADPAGGALAQKR